MKVALFGGSFNPIHNGHLEIANELVNKQIVDEVWFILLPSTIGEPRRIKKGQTVLRYRTRFEELLSRFREDPTDRNARALAELAGDASRALELTFEDSHTEKDWERFLKGYRLLLRILDLLSRAHTAGDMEFVLRNSPYPVLQLFHHTEELINSTDTDLEDKFSVGGYTVNLMSSPNEDWNDENIHAAREILERLGKVLQRTGFGKFARGRVIAFPGEDLPPSSHAPGPSVNAMYDRVADTFYMATTGDVPEVLANMVHETGHRVYYRSLSSNARVAWRAFFKSWLHHPKEVLARLETTWAVIRDKEYAQGAPLEEAESLKVFFDRNTDQELSMWMEIIAFGFDRSPSLSDILRNREEIKVFALPVTSYSATSPEELYAEVFKIKIVKGPRRIPGIVLSFFEMITPR